MEPNSSITLPAQPYSNVTEWIRGGNVTTTAGVTANSSITRRLSAKTDPNGALLPVGDWRREWVEYLDGAGRVVQSVDPLLTAGITTYTTSGSGMTILQLYPDGWLQCFDHKNRTKFRHELG